MALNEHNQTSIFIACSDFIEMNANGGEKQHKPHTQRAWARHFCGLKSISLNINAFAILYLVQRLDLAVGDGMVCCRRFTSSCFFLFLFTGNGKDPICY